MKVLFLALGVAAVSYATTVSYNPAPVTTTGWNPCGSYAGYLCETSAYFSPETLNTVYDNGIGTIFENAFNAWNASGGGQGWTLNNGGSLTGTFNVTTATAQQFAGVTLGGLTLNISVNNITLPAVPKGDQLLWAQGLYINYEPTTPLGSPAVTPYYAMDTSTLSGLACGGAITCPPAYPYQYPDNSFYDQPKADYLPPGTTQSFFDANAYLAIEDPTKKTLTVYDGISYGFENAVSPEPGTWMLLVCGLVLLAAGKCTRRIRKPLPLRGR